MISQRMKTKSILLKSRPQGMPAEENFEFREEQLPDLQEGQLLLKALYVSVDPYMRGRMSEAKSYVPPYNLNEPIRGGVVAEVVESRHDRYRASAVVLGNLPWQTYSISDGKGLSLIDPQLAPLSSTWVYWVCRD